MNKRIGFYINDFNPFHKGHQSICEYVIDNDILDEIHIVVNSDSNTSSDQKHNENTETNYYNSCVSIFHRFEMIYNQLYSSKYFGSDPRKMSRIFVERIMEDDDIEYIPKRISVSKDSSDYFSEDLFDSSESLPHSYSFSYSLKDIVLTVLKYRKLTDKLYLIVGSDVFVDSLKNKERPLEYLLKLLPNKTFIEYIVIKRESISDTFINNETMNDIPINNLTDEFLKDDTKILFLKDVPHQYASSKHVRDGNYKYIVHNNVQYIQQNHLYELDRIKSMGYNFTSLDLISGTLDSSVYKMVIEDGDEENFDDDINSRRIMTRERSTSLTPSKSIPQIYDRKSGPKIIYIKIGYAVDQKLVDMIFKEFGQVTTKYIGHNMLEMKHIKGYLLSDLLKDETEVSLSFDNFDEIGQAVGRFMKRLHISSTFNTSLQNIDEYKNICNKCKNSRYYKKFKTNPGVISLTHGAMNPREIFINFPLRTIKSIKSIKKDTYDTIANYSYIANIETGDIENIEIIPINFDKFVSTSKMGGIAAYEYYKFISSVWTSTRKAVNVTNFLKGFVIGYGDINDVSVQHTTSICKEYWNLEVI